MPNDTDRQQLFANEGFAIGGFQAVAGGSIVGLLNEYSTMRGLIGDLPLLLNFSLLALALLTSVLCMYFRHSYKVWDVKAQVSLDQRNTTEANDRITKASRRLTTMRWGMLVSVVLFIAAMLVFIVSLWWRWILLHCAV